MPLKGRRLWNQVVKGKYGEEREGWHTRIVKNIYRVVKVIVEDGMIAGRELSFVVGNAFLERQMVGVCLFECLFSHFIYSYNLKNC